MGPLQKLIIKKMLYILKLIIIFICLIMINISVIKCYNIKSVNTYKKLTIEDDRVCSPIVKRKIELKKNEYHALFITQTSTKDHNARWFVNWNCKFQVDASTYGGLFTVIQSLNFRKNITSGECIDYVMFRGKDGKTSKKICGYFSTDDYKINEFEGQISFEGKIDTEIYISREKLQNGETMDLKIVYTAFKRCNPHSLQYSCITNSSHFCINETFFNDSIVNCPYEFDCKDEGTCLNFFKDQDVVDTEDSSMVTKVVLSAVTSLFVSFVCVIIVIWLCRKMGTACCLSLNVDEPNSSRPQSRVIEIQTRDDPEETITSVSPTSPPSYDKDLPPSYESLFPPTTQR